MFARFVRSLIAFSVVFVAYQAYALLAVPVLEPEIARRASPLSTADERSHARSAVARYQEGVLAHYFPADHWSLTGLPKVIESGSVMLVVDDYRKDDRGRVDLTKCAALMFPTPRKPGAPPPDDAVILEAPGGARLQFDDNFQPSRGRIGKITSGEFPGRITIRSRMRDPGPDDDLLIVTRDVRINESMIFTPHEVSVQHGRSTGGGRRMEIKLLEEEHATSGLKIAGVQSIEIFENVKLALRMGKINPLRADGLARAAGAHHKVGAEIENCKLRIANCEVRLASPPICNSHFTIFNLQSVANHRLPSTARGRSIHLTAYPASDDASSWTEGPAIDSVYSRRGAGLGDEPAHTRPGDEPARTRRGDEPARGGREMISEPPLEITCAGSFRMDFTEFVATFRDRVHAWQRNLDGQSDQMTCRELRLAFGAGEDRREVRIDPRREPELARRQRRTLASLQPRRMEAVGEPVKVDSPTRQVSARCRNLSLDFVDQRLTLSGGRAVIVRAGSRVEAPVIRYQHPGENEDAAIGRMWVAGPGRLLAAPRSDQPEQTIEARWAEVAGVEFPVRLRPGAAGQSELSVLGRPVFTAPGMGRLTSDQLLVTLLETAPDGKDGPAIELGGGAGPRSALLPERIDATGRVEVVSPKLTAATDALSIWVLKELNSPERAAEAAADNAGAFAAGASGGGSPPDVSRRQAPATGPAYRLTAQRADLEVTLSGKRATPRTLVCRGEVDFRELATRRSQAPLHATGQQLRVDGLESEAMRLTISGDEAERATIAARGVTLHAREARLDQGKNRMWADGPGDARLQTKRDLFGQQTAAAADWRLSWRGGWVFDGRQITIRDQVYGEGPHDWLRTGKLVATLSRPVKFGKRTDAGEIEIAQIDCSRGVIIDHRSHDDLGQRSQERAKLDTLRIDQRSGVVQGTGPGWVRSVHLSSGGNPFAEIAGQGPASAKRPASGRPEKLRLLRVHFQEGLAGNYKTRQRQINFFGRVRAIYAPVVAWQQDMPVTPPSGLPPDTATLACEELQVSEDPMARLAPSAADAGASKIGPLELIAKRNVRLEGAAEDGSVFNAQAATASFNQAKELFVLQGDGASNATLWVRQPPKDGKRGGDFRHSSGTVSYWRKTGVVQTENFGASGYTPTATRPAPTQR